LEKLWYKHRRIRKLARSKEEVDKAIDEVK